MTAETRHAHLWRFTVTEMIQGKTRLGTRCCASRRMLSLEWINDALITFTFLAWIRNDIDKALRHFLFDIRQRNQYACPIFIPFRTSLVLSANYASRLALQITTVTYTTSELNSSEFHWPFLTMPSRTLETEYFAHAIKNGVRKTLSMQGSAVINGPYIWNAWGAT